MVKIRKIHYKTTTCPAAKNTSQGRRMNETIV